MANLYINENGSVIREKENHFIISGKDGSTKELPVEQVSSVTLMGASSMTLPAVKKCLLNKIPVSVFGGRGTYIGRLTSGSRNNARRLREQVYARDNKEFCAALARRILKAKVYNQIVVLQREEKARGICFSEEIRAMQKMASKIEKSKKVEKITGFEGNAARVYFSALGRLMPEGFEFSKRTRRPPQDPFNSMISLGYTILSQRIENETENRGLSPYIPFIHCYNDGYRSLSQDLIEEWRAPVVDSLGLNLILSGKMKREWFERDEESGGIIISTEGLAVYLSEFDRKMKRQNKYLSEEKTSVEYGIYLQTVALCEAVRAQDAKMYRPLRIR